MDWKIPLFNTNFSESEITSVTDVVKSGWLTMGEMVKNFENQFAEKFGIQNAIAVSNCTSALHLAFMSLGVGPGDEVICPSLTFVATANAIKYTGAKPVFADVKDFKQWSISADTIQRVRSHRTKAICVVHYAGYVCDMDEIVQYAKDEGLYIVEDCAHAPGATSSGISAGAIGDVGCFSFFSNKNMSTGEGGMITTQNDEIGRKSRLMRSHGMTTVTLDRHKGHAFSYDVIDNGYNYRPTEITAALGIEQLKKLDANNKNRREIIAAYRYLLKKGSVPISLPFAECDLDRSAAHIMPILLPERIDRNDVMRFMGEAGIQTSIHYRPIHTFKCYQSGRNVDLPLTEDIGNRTITLPLFPDMQPDQVEYIVNTLMKSVSRCT